MQECLTFRDWYRSMARPPKPSTNCLIPTPFSLVVAVGWYPILFKQHCHMKPGASIVVNVSSPDNLVAVQTRIDQRGAAKRRSHDQYCPRTVSTGSRPFRCTEPDLPWYWAAIGIENDRNRHGVTRCLVEPLPSSNHTPEQEWFSVLNRSHG